MANAPQSLVLASHNAGKLREITQLLSPLAIEVISAGALGLPEPEETGDTFEANAELKAVAAATAAKRWALADDSGLAVPALDGAPGIYSARWAGPAKDFSAAMQSVHEALLAKEVSTEGAAAYFVCALSLSDPQGNVRTVRGEVHGTLIYPPRGCQGFGYDPMFMPAGGALSFGEMEPDAKHAISHRAQAFAKLLDILRNLR